MRFGFITLLLTLLMGCVNSVNAQNSSGDPPQGITKYDDSKDAHHVLSVYPSVADHELNIQGPYILESIKLFDATGNFVKSYSVATRETTLSISELKSGLYFIKINDRFTFKVFKK